MKRLTELNSARKRWPLVLLGFIAACMAGSLLVFRHRFPYAARALGPPQLPSAMMRINDARILALSRGSKLWRLRANIVELSRDRRVVSLTGVTQGVVYHGRTPVLNVEAGVVRYDTFSGDLLASHRVRARGRQGQVISTEEIKWKQADMVVIATTPVHYRSALGCATARNFKLDVRSRQLELFDVSGRLNVESLF